MKQISFRIGVPMVAVLTILLSCTTKRGQQAAVDCPPKACTMEFRTVGVVFTDSSGDTLQVKNFSARLKSKGEKLPSAESESATTLNQFYLVATDGDKSVLSIQGDTVQVSATHPATGQTKTTDFVISGGRCECHINKVSGPEKITFE
ncbi:hypothetical protein [Olivibacter sp. XZL3]|uniref:hypothetical protein n=1 Tax=Olivibacter sp. XZL3 TaxID=1735116 RepID=UPI001065DF78|nr:hypothetical protein [Olivibacter sp. XZL3]